MQNLFLSLQYDFPRLLGSLGEAGVPSQAGNPRQRRGTAGRTKFTAYNSCFVSRFLDFYGY